MAPPIAYVLSVPACVLQGKAVLLGDFAMGSQNTYDFLP